MASEKTLGGEELEKLIELLERRLAVIGDAELREKDPEGQLAKLQEVSEAITAFHREKQDRIPNRLNHFLESSSLHKALDWARDAVED